MWPLELSCGGTVQGQWPQVAEGSSLVPLSQPFHQARAWLEGREGNGSLQQEDRALGYTPDHSQGIRIPCDWGRLLTDSKAMEIHCTRPSLTPTAPWDSCPGSRLGSGSSLHSGCNICRKEEML